MIIRAAEGFLLREGQLPTVEELNALGIAELRGDPLVSYHRGIGECIGQYDGPDLPTGWKFVPMNSLPVELQPLLILVDALADKEYVGLDLPTEFLNAIEVQKNRYS